MTTFTTEDRIIAEKGIADNVEPIPFAGLVNLEEQKPTPEVKINTPDDLQK